MEESNQSIMQSPNESQATSGRQNFKTFNLLRQQDDLISQFENNLQKTLDLLNKRQTERYSTLTTDDKNAYPQEEVNNMEKAEYEFPSGYNAVPAHLEEDHYPMNPTSVNQSMMPLNEANTQLQDEIQAEDLSQISNRSNGLKTSILEAEIRSLKVQLEDYEKENEILKSSLSTLSLARNTYSENEARRDTVQADQREVNELRSKVDDLQSENENLRQDVIKTKTESFRKFETLQKNNDELLESYEERFKMSMKNITDRYENEIKDLQKEITDLQSNERKLEERSKQTKGRLSETINELEREKQELLNKMNNTLLLNESHISGMQSPINRNNISGLGQSPEGQNYAFDQVLKEKTELEKKYNDLFSAYNSLLLHNKSLCAKLEKNGGRAELPPPYKPSESARNRRSPKASPSNSRISHSPFRSNVKEDLKRTISPSKKRSADLDTSTAAALQSSKGSTDGKVGKIRKNKEIKVNSSLNSSVDEFKKQNNNDYSVISDHSVILKPKNPNQMSFDDLRQEDLKSKDTTSRSVRKSARPSSAVVSTKNTPAPINTSKPVVSPRFQSLKESTQSTQRQSPHYMKSNAITDNRRKKSIDTPQNTKKSLNLRERSLSAKKTDNKENCKTENCDISITPAHSTSKNERKSIASTTTSKKIPIYSKVRKI